MSQLDSDRHGEEGPLTGHELRDIKDAADLYQSGSFKLQIDALLPNVRPKESGRQQLDQFLMSLRTHILSLPSIPAQNPLTAAQILAKQGVAVPFAPPHPSREDKWKVAFQPPREINVVGSWGNGTSVKKKNSGRFGVDVSVEMPEALFQEKDYLDGRFFHKKSYYLAVLAQSIASNLDVDTFYSSPLGDPRLTTLVLRPRKGSTSDDFSKSHAEIYVIPILPSPSPISLAKLSPSHPNVRISSSVSPCPTPIYNNTVLLSTYPKLALLSTHELKNSSPAFHDAHTLLRVWANQRGYGDGELCVRGFEGKGSFWTGLLRLLVFGEEPVSTKNGKLRRPLGKGLSSYQLFKAALDFLAKHKFGEIPSFTKTIDGHKYPPEQYIAHHAAVFVEGTSTINFLSDVPLTSLDLLSHDAKETLEQLSNPGTSDDAFAECFLKSERSLFTRLDAVIRVDLSQASRSQSALALVEHGSFDAALLASVASILRRGLGNRTKAIAILQPGTPSRPISSAQTPSTSTVHIGLIYDPAHAFRLVDHGPSAENQDSTMAQEFRQLWGDRAELRRFKDGRIAESVVWEVATSDERAHIPASIVEHLLQLHFGISAEYVRTLQSPFDDMLRLPDDVHRLHRAAGGYKPALTAFDGIVRSLKALDEQLPLALLNVSPISEYLRYTSAFAPLPVPASTLMALPESLRFLPTIPIILEFEKSSKWPDDLKAIQTVKLAFFETIARSLMASIPGLKASVAIGDSSNSFQGRATLEIFTAEGWAFSASIWHDREVTLLDRIIGSGKTLASHSDQEYSVREQRDAKAARELYTRTFIHSPRHHRAIANLCHKYSAYSGTVRLVKRWLAAHWLLQSHVSEEAIEIICARPFVGGKQASTEDTATVPHSKERGFALVITFLGEWKWEEPLFIPLYEDNTPATAPEIFAVSVKQGVWTLSTAEDRAGRMWTSHGPDHVAAHRLRALAKEAIKIIKDAEEHSDIKSLFSHSTDDYDVVIHLNPAVLPRYYQNINPNSSVWSRDSRSGAVESTPRPGFDLLPLFLEDLQCTFADTLKFFADPFGGDRIGAIWLPDLKTPRPFRALAGFSSEPLPKEDKAKDKELVMLNRRSVLDDIERLGSGLIKNIVTRDSM